MKVTKSNSLNEIEIHESILTSINKCREGKYFYRRVPTNKCKRNVANHLAIIIVVVDSGGSHQCLLKLVEGRFCEE